ncbi:MAG TPA: RNA polymerase sigma factor [Iamia sp.]
MESSSYEVEFPALVSLAAHVAGRIVGDPDDAEDIAVETLARAYERWARIQGYAPRWVVRTATNLAIDQLRRRPTPIHLMPARGEVTVEGAVIEADTVVALLGGLSRRQRRVVVLVVLCGYTAVEVGEILGCAPTTVKTHLTRALSALRRTTSPREGASTPWTQIP